MPGTGNLRILKGIGRPVGEVAIGEVAIGEVASCELRVGSGELLVASGELRVGSGELRDICPRSLAEGRPRLGS